MFGEFGGNSCWLLISPAQLTRTLIRVLLMGQVDIAGRKDDKTELLLKLALNTNQSVNQF